MHPLEKIIKKVCLGKNLFSVGEKIVVGVSGGPDSTALFRVLANLSDQLEISLIAVYVDHGLRPEESPGELKFVSELASEFSALFEYANVDVASQARQKKISVEDSARQLRYDFFNEIAQKHGAHKIAVAHNADDQAEELLIRLIRGTGKKGLSGMELVRDNIVRPFLSVSKEDILKYLDDCSSSFCEDSSNKERVYLRNKVRLDLLPFIEENFNPGIKKQLRQTAEIFAEEESFLDQVTAEKYLKVVGGQDSSEIEISEFESLHPAIQRRLVEKLLWGMGNKPSFRKIENIIQLANDGHQDHQIHLDKGLRGQILDGQLIFSFPSGKVSKRGNLFANQPSSFSVEIPSIGVYKIDEKREVEISILEKVPDSKELTAKDRDFFDLEKIVFPLVIRSIKQGDRFHPLGSSGRKKVGDFLGDLKLSKKQRGRVMVLENSRKIAALLKLRIDHSLRICATTTKVLCVRVSERTL